MTEQAAGFVVAVVDDDQSILRSLEYLLESADYAVRVFTSGRALLESEWLPKVDCVISDIDMPGMDGFELVRQSNALRPGLPAILVTGYPDRLKTLSAPPGKNIRYFTKPFDGPKLLAAVGEAIQRYRG